MLLQQPPRSANNLVIQQPPRCAWGFRGSQREYRAGELAGQIYDLLYSGENRTPSMRGGAAVSLARRYSVREHIYTDTMKQTH